MAAAVVVVAGVAVGLTAAIDGGSSKPKTSPTTTRSASVPSLTAPGQLTQPGVQPVPQPQTQPQTQTPTQTQTQTSTIPNLPSINWLGMQIITGPSGPVVTTVAIGRPGDADGFEPGDIITTFDNQNVDTAVQISRIAAKLPLGTTVPIGVVRGSTEITMAVTMKERPTVRP